MYRAKKKGKGRLEHEVLEGSIHSWPQERWHERRATARVLCHRQVRVRGQGQEEELTQFAIIRNISCGGVSVYLDSKFPINTLLMVEPLCAGRAPLLGRVVNVTGDGKGWRHGCELAAHLTKDDLSFWIEAASPAPKQDQGATDQSTPQEALATV
jgi:hypothetical protein